MQSKGKVFVGMSGGVDSSVSAALLRRDGYEVTGVFIKVWQADFLPCSWREERRDAMRAAAHLGIPFRTLDLEEAYKREVVDYMIREYAAGRVPNPDVMCNKYVKFGAFFEYAKAHGADWIATGHYARRESQVTSHKSQESVKSQKSLPADLQLQTCNYKLLVSIDSEKDQSYFLWPLDQEVLAHTLFPVGGLIKQEVRTIAEQIGLPNAQKKDSQGLCFIGKVDMVDFLKHYLHTVQGDVLSEDGEVIGLHAGAMLYTIGQRKKLDIKKISEHEKPYFVVAKDIEANTITVAHRDTWGESHSTQTLIIHDTHLIDQTHTDAELGDAKITARIRYRGELLPVEIRSGFHEGGETEVHIAQSTAGVAVGQSIVFYLGDECLGGGIIAEVR